MFELQKVRFTPIGIIEASVRRLSRDLKILFEFCKNSNYTRDSCLYVVPLICETTGH